MAIGYIYGLSNPRMKGLVKIGYTCKKSVETRASEISSSTGVPTPYQIEFYLLTEDAKNVEKEIHKALAKYRENPKREHFEISIKDAYIEAKKWIKAPSPNYTRPNMTAARTTNKRACNRCGALFRRGVDGEFCPNCGY